MACHVDTQVGGQQSPIDIVGYVPGGVPQLSFE